MQEVLDHYWIVEWNLKDQPPYTQKTLPYPCVNLVFDLGKTAVFGVVTGAFDYTLHGTGKVLGLRFKPGGFYGLLGAPVRSITDKTVSLQAALGLDGNQAELAVLTCNDDQSMVDAATALLLPLLTPVDQQLIQIQQWLALLQTNTDMQRVEQFAKHIGVNIRTLQQMFVDYIGVSPKWILRRYRLHDLAFCLAEGTQPDLAQLAVDLGYFDQAHLSKDFKKLIGCTPASYRAQEKLNRAILQHALT